MCRVTHNSGGELGSLMGERPAWAALLPAELGPAPQGWLWGEGHTAGLGRVRLGPCSLWPGPAVGLSDQSHKQVSVKAALGWGSPGSAWGLGSPPSSPSWSPVSGSVWERPPPLLARGAAAHPLHGLLPELPVEAGREAEELPAGEGSRYLPGTGRLCGSLTGSGDGRAEEGAGQAGNGEGLLCRDRRRRAAFLVLTHW